MAKGNKNWLWWALGFGGLAAILYTTVATVQNNLNGMPQLLVKGFSITKDGGYVNILVQNPGSQTFQVNSVTANIMDGTNRIGTLSFLPGAGNPYTIAPSSSSTLKLNITIDPIGSIAAAIGIGQQIFADISKGGSVIDSVGNVLNLDPSGAMVKNGISILKYFTDPTAPAPAANAPITTTPVAAQPGDVQGSSYSAINDGTGNLVDESTGIVYDQNGGPTGYRFDSDNGTYVDSQGNAVDANGAPVSTASASASDVADNSFTDYTDVSEGSDGTEFGTGDSLSGISGTTITLTGVANISGVNIPFTQTLTGAQQSA